MPDVVRIRAKINTVQISIAFCSFTVLNVLNDCLVVVWSDFRQVVIDTAVHQWRKCLQACVRANGEHFEHLLWTNLQTIMAFFMCFWFKWLLSIVSAFYCVDAWWSIGLLCKALSLLRTVKEQNVNCWYLHGINLCSYSNDIWHFFYLLDRWY